MKGQLPHTLPKEERLCGKKGISQLLAKGKHGSVQNLRYMFVQGTGGDTNRILVSVPKKLFKRAVRRNLLKRRIRESFRKQKHDLAVQQGMDILFTYSSKDILAYEEIYDSVGQIIKKINERIS